MKEKEIKKIATIEKNRVAKDIFTYYRDYDNEGLDSEGLELLKNTMLALEKLCKHIVESRF